MTMTAKKNPGKAVGAASRANHSLAGGAVSTSYLTLTPELEAHIDRVVASLPPFTAGQRALLTSILGGDR